MHHFPPTIGVVIVSYNTAPLLCACLESLHCCTLPLQIVVVDNASADDSVQRIYHHFPNVEVLVLERNIGFAAGNNIGIRQLLNRNSSTHSLPCILLLNPDTIVHPNAIESLNTFLQAHPRVGVVGPRLINPDGSLQRAAFRFPTLMMSLLEAFPPGETMPGRLYNSWWHGRYPQEAEGTTPFPIDHPLGACMLIRWEVIEHVGLLNENLFMYSEEIEWCWRIQKQGWAIWHVPQAHITHIGGAATQQLRRRMLVELHRSRIIFFQQHYPARFLTIHRLITRIGMVHAMLQAWRDYMQSIIEQDELRMRLLAYGEVIKL